MCETCEHINTFAAARLVDPTRTTVLRNSFAANMRRRFKTLSGKLQRAVAEDDVLGLLTHPIATNVAPRPGAFSFGQSEQRIAAFMDWVHELVESDVLDISNAQRMGSSINSAWTNVYVQDSYKRGVIRAQYELKKRGVNVPTFDRGDSLEAVLGGGFHMDRVGLLYSRVFSNLKGITAAMEDQIGRVLAEGMIHGDHPSLLARKIVATVHGPIGDLGLTDTLGRFIPARRRAEMLARTEVIRAHHLANIQEYKNWGAQGVKVIAEWSTAGDSRVCIECSALQGNRYTLNEIETMIPVHPQCRCIAIPITTEADATAEAPRVEEVVEASPRRTQPWTNMANMDEVSEAMFDKYKVGIHGPANQLDRANAIGQSLDEVWGTLDDFYGKFKTGTYDGLPSAEIYLESGAYAPGSSTIYAQYTPSSRLIEVFKKARVRTTDSLQFGKYNIGLDIKSVFRHEYGHHIWYKARTYLTDEASTAFNIAKNEFQTYFWNNKQLIKKQVSEYASSSVEEFFAECFSAYTSPKYGTTQALRLPDEIEELIRAIIGPRRTL